MKKIANISAYIFIFAVVILSAISIMGVWDFFSGNVITKSFESIGLLALVAIIILIADHFIDKKVNLTVNANGDSVPVMADDSSIIFKGIRSFTLAVLICAVAVLALLGILAIWEVLSGTVLHKSIASIAIIGFASFITVITCLEREESQNPKKKQISGGLVVAAIIIGCILVPFILGMLY